jgi:hypothetical protein
MRAGILIVGSLLWRQTEERKQWREARLLLNEKLSVQAPIYYGRLSNGGKYTMTFDGKGEMGRAVLVPCKAKVTGLKDLIAEAQSLWEAESSAARLGRIGANWGCVGVASRGGQPKDLAADWMKWFHENKTRPVPPVDEAGVLRIPWPQEAQDSDIDLMLATSTRPEPQRPTPQQIADAWIAQGGEDYFFSNVRNDIRTPGDLTIWSRFVEKQAPCLKKPEYTRAISVLRSESAAETASAD